MSESQALSALRSLRSAESDSEFVVIEKIDSNSGQVAQESLVGAQSIHVETYGQGVFVNLMRSGGFAVLEFNSKSKSATSLHLVTLDASAQTHIESYDVDGDLSRIDALTLIKKSDEFSNAFLNATSSEVARLLRTFGGAEVGAAGTADQKGYLGVPATVTKLAQTSDELLNLRGQYCALQLWPVRYAPSIPLFAANPEEATRLARNELIKLAEEFLAKSGKNAGSIYDLLDLDSIHTRSELKLRLQRLGELNLFLDKRISLQLDSATYKAGVLISRIPLQIGIDKHNSDRVLGVMSTSGVITVWIRTQSGEFILTGLSEGGD
jgi:hypothetical protein